MLLDSDLFRENKDYVRRQFVFGLLQVRQHFKTRARLEGRY